jgi:hypothetical protein
MSDENKNVVFLNPDHATMKALGLHNESGIRLEFKGEPKPARIRSCILHPLWPEEEVPEAWMWHRCSDGPMCEAHGLFASDRRVRCTDAPPPRLVGDIWPTLHPKDWDMDELLKLVMEDYRR